MHQLFWMKTQSQSKTDHNPHHFPFTRDSNTNIWWLAVGEGNWVFSMLYFSWDIFFINFSYWLTYFDFLAVAHWWFSVLVEKKLCLSRIYEELMTHFDIDLFWGEFLIECFRLLWQFFHKNITFKWDNIFLFSGP